ncbi:MAG: DUF3099 domain-containing protein [Propionibacterium sp.]|mgnify:FL=1|nr:DUF3099 domain-containing protein [Propionibacterium sp.]
MAAEGHLITRASRGRTLDLEERQKRYAITMGIRTVCFLLFLVVPGYWKVLALAGAALLPIIAVVLANASDRRLPPEPERPDDSTRRALPPTEVIHGSVDDE